MTAIAGSLDTLEVLSDLATNRPVFHSEADLQHALAWRVHQLDPMMQVRLEVQVQPRKYLDLLFHRPDTGRFTGVELKYLTALWSGQDAGEAFALRNHGAQDVNGYHIVNDVARLEGFCSGRDKWNGVLILITNDPAYWRAPTHGRVTNAQAFRVHDGLELFGPRAWGPSTGLGTMKGIESPIQLAGRYQLQWRAYSHLDGPRGQFRALVVEVNADRPSEAIRPTL